MKWNLGEDFGFQPKGTEEEREEAVKKWEAWWKEKGATFLPKTPDLTVLDKLTVPKRSVYRPKPEATGGAAEPGTPKTKPADAPAEKGEPAAD